ncbi:MAG: T9SS type A sorting domain-containing protein, partial [Parafilimonas sp.]|nr:T9SS type A sorting domain-containing protein [Parafilimonas sp.]
MKKIVLLTALLVTSYNLFAFTTQGVWRWRNDDGSETAATWKAAQNTPITIHSKDSVIRLRIELYNNGSGGLLDGALFEDSSNEVGGHWDTIKLAANSNAFMLAGTSPFVADLEPTTHQLNGQSIPPYTFVAGKEIVSTERLPKQSLSKGQTTEFEYVIKPTANIKPNVTYYFRVDAANYSFGYVFPSLVSQVNPLPHASIADKSMDEGDSGTSLMKFKVTLDHVCSTTVKIKYATADSTAKAGSDYVAQQGTISLPAGTTSKTISITINGDTKKEPNERFKVMLSKPVNALLSDSIGIGTIKNDDAAALASAIEVNNSKIANNATVKILPDPNKGNFVIQMQLPAKETETMLTLYSNSGEKVWQQNMGNVSGTVTKNVYLQDKLIAGMYSLMIQRSDMNYTVKLLINK